MAKYTDRKSLESSGIKAIKETISSDLYVYQLALEVLNSTQFDINQSEFILETVCLLVTPQAHI